MNKKVRATRCVGHWEIDDLSFGGLARYTASARKLLVFSSTKIRTCKLKKCAFQARPEKFGNLLGRIQDSYETAADTAPTGSFFFGTSLRLPLYFFLLHSVSEFIVCFVLLCIVLFPCLSVCRLFLSFFFLVNTSILQVILG